MRISPQRGAAPFLNSKHPGIVVVGFCDGSVRTISENVDQGVYLRLLTSGLTQQRSSIIDEILDSDGADDLLASLIVKYHQNE